jgi:hypothetical protein
MLKLEIDEKKAQDLRAIAALNDEILISAAEALEASDSLLRKSDIRDVLAQTIGEEAAGGLTDMAVSFGAFVDSHDADLDDVFAALIEGAEEADLGKEIIRELESRLPVFKRICAIPRVSLIGKSMEIRDATGTRLLRSKIFTQSHPIFDSGRDKVEGSIVTSSLQLDFLNNRSERECFEVTLTLRELRQLKDELDVAIKKAEGYTDFLKTTGLAWVLNYDKR